MQSSRMLRTVATSGLRFCSAAAAPSTTQLIKEIRASTGAGLMDCKKALTASDNDVEAALKWLETRGIAKADKKRSRVAANGVVAAVQGGEDGASGVCVAELNSESDFVAKTQAFGGLVGVIAPAVRAAEAAGSAEAASAALTAEALNADAEVSKAVTGAIATTGENIVLRRAVYVPRPEHGAVGFYVHNKSTSTPDAGLTCAVVSLAPEPANAVRDHDEFVATARQVAQHIVAESLSSDKNTPLREQKFMQSEKTVGGFLKQRAKAVGCKKIQVLIKLLLLL